LGFIPDSNLKTIVIPIQISNGTVNYFYDGPFPKIAENTVGELIIPESAVEDKETVKFFTEERTIEIFPMETTFYVELKPSGTDNKSFVSLPIRDRVKSDPRKFSVVIIKEPLNLVLRASKRPRLDVVRCNIPALDSDATSLNHAYTLLSQEFERDRISHVSNVFNTVYFQHPYDKGYYPLDDIRSDRDLLYDRTLKKYDFKKREDG
jgi:hypothetical protein